MSDPNAHPDCPRCKGEGFYLRREGHGWYRDGSFGHNDWQDCSCDPWTPAERLPAPVDPYRAAWNGPDTIFARGRRP